MSVVVALKSGDTVYVGADSLITSYATSVLKDGQAKAWKEPNGDYIMGLSGFIRDMNILSCQSVMDELLILSNAYIDVKHMVKFIVPNIMGILERENRIEKKDGIHEMLSILIFAKDDKLFYISSDGGVYEPDDDYVAIGSGCELADGAFESIKNSITTTPQQKVATLVMAACTKNPFVGYPIKIINTKNDEVIIIEDKESAESFIANNIVNWSNIEVPIKDNDYSQFYDEPSAEKPTIKVRTYKEDSHNE